MNARLLEHVSEHSKVKAVWSDEGRIIALLKNNKKNRCEEAGRFGQSVY
jgi:hypothetical protein